MKAELVLRPTVVPVTLHSFVVASFRGNYDPFVELLDKLVRW